MKKPTILTLLIFIIVCSAHSQNAKSRFGLIVAGTLASWSGNDAEILGEALSGTSSAHSVLGYSLGAFLEIRLNNSFVLQPELYYTNKGCKYTGTLTYDDYDDSYSFDAEYLFKLNYIQVPVLIKISPLSKKMAPTFTAFAGPYLGFETGSIIKLKVSYEGESESDKMDFEDIESTDLGVIVGAGLMFSSGLQFNVQYQKGLSKVIPDADVYNSVYMATLGFTY